MARVKSLARLKVVIDELRNREASGRRIGVIEQDTWAENGAGGRVFVIDDSPRQAEKLRAALAREHHVQFVNDHEPGGSGLDLIIVAMNAGAFDALQLIARLQSGEATRHVPILAVVNPDDPQRCVRALELGAQDIIYRPVDPEELRARARSAVRRRRYVHALRRTLDTSLELAVTDQLTGLFNRRFLMTQLTPLTMRASKGGEPVSVIIADIDYFKRINDAFGHDVGDEVLKEFASRMATNFRPMDYVCRMGGEEFAIVMPNTRADYATLVAERLRRHVAGAPFAIRGGAERIDVTVSLGVAASIVGVDTAETLLKRADTALYKAKQNGRNRVIGEAA
jgi:two-component system cell cycle response regulator